MFKDDKNWHVPYMVDQMLKADDLFFDAVSQIRMPIWSSGRVVLTGDAAHATSFLSGQGSSCALEIGRAHECTPVTNAHLVCRLLLEKKMTNENNIKLKLLLKFVD